jgi:hypothetical protein
MFISDRKTKSTIGSRKFYALARAVEELWPKLGDGVNGKAEYHSVFEPRFFIEGAIFRACQAAENHESFLDRERSPCPPH